MGTGLLHLHSFLPFILLVLLIIVFVLSLIQWQQGKPSSTLAFKLAKITFILSHVQLTAGILLLIIGERAKAMFSQEGAMKTIMSTTELRVTFVEHPLTMLIGVILLTVGYIQAKKLKEVARAKKLALFFGFALVLILVRIPWDMWLN